jgi:hypothetical protein
LTKENISLISRQNKYMVGGIIHISENKIELLFSHLLLIHFSVEPRFDKYNFSNILVVFDRNNSINISDRK